MLARDIEDTFSLILQADLQITQWMASILKTQLHEAVKEDVYYADENRIGSDSPYYMIYLSRGFLKSSVPVVIQVADAFGKWDEGTPVDPLTVKVDYDKGYITIADKFPKGQYIKVSYAAGFPTEDVEIIAMPSVLHKVYTGTPSWLVGIGITGAIEIFKGLKNWERAPDKVKVKQKVSLTVTRTLDIEQLLVPYLRFAPYALQPIDA